VVVALLLSTTVLASPASAADSPVLIGVVLPTLKPARWATEEKIFVAHAQGNGDKVIFQYSNVSAATQTIARAHATEAKHVGSAIARSPHTAQLQAA